jgi:hypothetical protein
MEDSSVSLVFGRPGGQFTNFPIKSKTSLNFLPPLNSNSPSRPGRQNLGLPTRKNNEWAMKLRNEPAAMHPQDEYRQLPRIVA